VDDSVEDSVETLQEVDGKDEEEDSPGRASVKEVVSSHVRHVNRAKKACACCLTLMMDLLL
jgi:hypothetical protein